MTAKQQAKYQTNKRAREEVAHQIIGTLDAEALERNGMCYGAKGANLLALQEALRRFDSTSLARATFSKIEIPPFHLIPAALYVTWKNGEDITESLRAHYDAMKSHRALMVRSSAVMSEDGAQTTGAGVYDSILLRRGHTFDAFAKAVCKVYASCENDSARRYRAENDITAEETMGLVIQLAVYDTKDEDYYHDSSLPEESLMEYECKNHGHLNSTRPHASALVDIRFNAIKIPLIFRKPDPTDIHAAKRFDTQSIYGHTRFNQIEDATFRYQSDQEIAQSDLLMMATIMEQHYGCPVQIEFVVRQDQDENGCTIHDSPTRIHLVQVRPLPQKMFTETAITFPDDLNPIAEFDAAGLCDETLPVITIMSNASVKSPDNGDKEGIVIIELMVKNVWLK